MCSSKLRLGLPDASRRVQVTGARATRRAWPLSFLPPHLPLLQAHCVRDTITTVLRCLGQHAHNAHLKLHNHEPREPLRVVVDRGERASQKSLKKGNTLRSTTSTNKTERRIRPQTCVTCELV